MNPKDSTSRTKRSNEENDTLPPLATVNAPDFKRASKKATIKLASPPATRSTSLSDRKLAERLESRVKGHGLQLSVRAGRVTVRGELPSQRVKRQILRKLQESAGVNMLIDGIRTQD